MTVSTLEPGIPTDYYAPEFRVEVEGQELAPEAVGDVLQVKVVMDIKNMTSFELKINNWDDADFDFKYSDTTMFDIGNRVHVQLGYADRLLSMMRGQITSLSPRFPASGPPTIDVSGQDGMLKLRDRRPSGTEEGSYRKVTDGDIARRIVERNQMACRVDTDGPCHKLVVQRNLDDATFLMERANRIDFDVYVLTDPETGKDTLHFVSPRDGRDGNPIRVYELVWGESLISFNPTLTAAHQVSTVTVRGWDPRTKSRIVYTSTEADLPASGRGASGSAGTGAQGASRGTTGPQAAGSLGGGRRQVTVDSPVTSEQEAQRLARAILAERSYEFLTGTGRVIGLPDLRPGDNLFLTRLGSRFSGSFYVTKVEHTIGSSGYFTSFHVRRPYQGELP